MNDYIKREDALDMFDIASSEDELLSLINNLPAADVRKNVQGEWKHLGGDEWACSECGYVISTEGSWEHPHECGALFCENCGADVRKRGEAK